MSEQREARPGESTYMTERVRQPKASLKYIQISILLTGLC
jgi:hypothetical protein